MTLKGKVIKIKKFQFLSLCSVCYETFLAQSVKQRLKRIAGLEEQLCQNMKIRVVYHVHSGSFGQNPDGKTDRKIFEINRMS